MASAAQPCRRALRFVGVASSALLLLTSVACSGATPSSVESPSVMVIENSDIERLVVADAVRDTFELKGDGAIDAIDVSQWRTTLSQAFEQSFGATSTTEARGEVGATLTLLRADLSLVAKKGTPKGAHAFAGLGTDVELACGGLHVHHTRGPQRAQVARIDYRARVERPGQAPREVSGTVYAEGEVRRGEDVPKSVDAVLYAMYRDIAAQGR